MPARQMAGSVRTADKNLGRTKNPEAKQRFFHEAKAGCLAEFSDIRRLKGRSMSRKTSRDYTGVDQ